jgi:alpha-tubulin suppressor-like RCC1 family protein
MHHLPTTASRRPLLLSLPFLLILLPSSLLLPLSQTTCFKNRVIFEAMEAPTFLRSALHRNWAYHVFKHLTPHETGRLEQCLASASVFTEPAVTPLLRMVAGRMQAVAEKEGATMLVPLDEGRGGRITWATELLWIYVAMGRVRVGGAKKMISAGCGSHSLVTPGKAGKTWSFGSGEDGRLGHGGTGSEVVPRLIEALSGVVVKQVAAGYAHSMVLTSDGDVFTWGCGYCGRLGHGNTDRQLVPKRVEGLTNVTDIAAGVIHSVAVGEGGAVYTWGNNEQGQLGLGDHGNVHLVPTEVPGVNEVVAVAAGSLHSLALSRDGTIMACGWNSSGQLGLGDTDDRDTFTVVAGLRGVVDIDAGRIHSLAVTVEGGLHTWGMGLAIGHGGDNNTSRLVPAKVTGGGIGEAMVVQVAAGEYHAMALTASGELWAWGKGHRGQLGHGDKANLAVPRVVDGIEGAVTGMAGSSSHSLVTTAEGRVLAFGGKAPFAACGGLGLGAGVEEALTPTVIDGIVIGREGEEGKEGNYSSV